MGGISQALENKASGVYLIRGDFQAQGLESLCKRHGLTLVHLDGTGIRSKDQFMGRASQALGFPDYFGANWDAFEECLNDMVENERTGLVALFDSFDSFSEAAPEDFDTAVEVFKDCARSWRDQGRTLLILLRGKVRRGSVFPLLEWRGGEASEE